jgi:hypothetical protein
VVSTAEEPDHMTDEAHTYILLCVRDTTIEDRINVLDSRELKSFAHAAEYYFEHRRADRMEDWTYAILRVDPVAGEEIRHYELNKPWSRVA